MLWRSERYHRRLRQRGLLVSRFTLSFPQFLLNHEYDLQEEVTQTVLHEILGDRRHGILLPVEVLNHLVLFITRVDLVRLGLPPMGSLT